MRTAIIGCGYVGAKLGAQLSKVGHEVYGIRRSSGADSTLKSFGIIPVHADITKPETLSRTPANFDWVVHCASSSGGTALDYRRTYVEGTRNLLAWLDATPPQKLVYTNSTSVYGQTDGSTVDETSQTEPASATGRILLQTEALLLEAARFRRTPTVLLRVAGIYGPERGYWLQQFLKGEPKIEGKGERLLNMVHRDDVAGGILAALRHGAPGQIYNLVDEEPVSQLVLFQWLADRLGRSLPASEASAVSSKRGMTHKRVSNQKLERELGYRFLYPTFREGFEAEIKRLGK